MSKRKKTREEKIIADLRRKLSATESSSGTVQYKVEKKVEEIKKPEVSNFSFKTPQTAAFNTTTYDYKLVKHDLLKTTALSSLAFSAFIVLYWWLELGGQKLLK